MTDKKIKRAEKPYKNHKIMPAEDKAMPMEEALIGEEGTLEEEGTPEGEKTPENQEGVEEPTLSSEPEKAEKSSEIGELRGRLEHWRAKAQKLEEQLKRYAPKAGVKPSSGEDEFRERVEFLLANRDITQQEYDHLAAVALRDSGKITAETLAEAKEKEADYLSFLRKKVENSKKIPGSTPPGTPPSIYKTPEEIAKMTSEEHREYERKILEMESKGIV